jgi:hypothetical protein
MGMLPGSEVGTEPWSFKIVWIPLKRMLGPSAIIDYPSIDVETHHVLEDAPFGLIPAVRLAEIAQVETPRTKAASNS